MRIDPDGWQFRWRLCGRATVVAPGGRMSWASTPWKVPLKHPGAKPAQEVCAAAGPGKRRRQQSIAAIDRVDVGSRSVCHMRCSFSLFTGGSGRQKRPRLLDIVLCPRDRRATIEEASREITHLLRAWSGGDQAALGRLAERVYPELRRMARRYMKNERQANTLQSTALVHEVYSASWT